MSTSSEKQFDHLMKLLHQNKINKKNAWNYNINEVLNNENDEGCDFQKLGKKLDVSINIFSSKVASIEDQAYRVRGDLSRIHSIQNKSEKDEEKTEKRKRTRTTVIDESNINTKQFDCRYTIDPLITRNKGVELSNPHNLLLNNLELDPNFLLNIDGQRIRKTVEEHDVKDENKYSNFAMPKSLDIPQEEAVKMEVEEEETISSPAADLEIPDEISAVMHETLDNVSQDENIVIERLNPEEFGNMENDVENGIPIIDDYLENLNNEAIDTDNPNEGDTLHQINDHLLENESAEEYDRSKWKLSEASKKKKATSKKRQNLKDSEINFDELFQRLEEEPIEVEFENKFQLKQKSNKDEAECLLPNDNLDKMELVQGFNVDIIHIKEFQKMNRMPHSIDVMDDDDDDGYTSLSDNPVYENSISFEDPQLVPATRNFVDEMMQDDYPMEETENRQKKNKKKVRKTKRINVRSLKTKIHDLIKSKKEQSQTNEKVPLTSFCDILNEVHGKDGETGSLGVNLICLLHLANEHSYIIEDKDPEHGDLQLFV